MAEDVQPEAPKPVELLEAQLTALSDLHNNVSGSIQKAVRIQGDLTSADFEAHADRLSGPFSDLSNAAEKLQALIHDIEIERNRMRNEE